MFAVLMLSKARIRRDVVDTWSIQAPATIQEVQDLVDTNSTYSPGLWLFIFFFVISCCIALMPCFRRYVNLIFIVLRGFYLAKARARDGPTRLTVSVDIEHAGEMTRHVTSSYITMNVDKLSVLYHDITSRHQFDGHDRFSEIGEQNGLDSCLTDSQSSFFSVASYLSEDLTISVADG